MSERTAEAAPERTHEAAAAWFATVGSIVAWMVHLTSEAAITRFTCTRGGLVWVMHLLTAGTLGVAVLATVVALRLARSGGDDEEAGTQAGTTRFLGVFGVMMGVTNIVLILLEGSYVLFIKPCA